MVFGFNVRLLMACTTTKERLALRHHALTIFPGWKEGLILGLIAFVPQPLMASQVMRVIDGDSLIVKENGLTKQMRLGCVDAPEISQYPYGRLATNAFRGLIPADSNIKIFPFKNDKYGRTVGHVYTPGGINVAEELVRKGFVFVYTKYLSECDGPKLLLLESQARDSRKGFWSKSKLGITRPWIYRRGTKARLRCSEISSWGKAQLLLQEGHVYLDRNNDGEACEDLR